MKLNTCFYQIIGATILVTFLICLAFFTFSSAPVCADDGGLSSPWDEVNGGSDTTMTVTELVFPRFR